MTYFIQPDIYGHLSDATVSKLKDAAMRDIALFYVEETKRAYADSFLLDAEEVASLIVNGDGSAEGNGRKWSGQPSIGAFIEYVRRGR